jgi:hypothetical protein
MNDATQDLILDELRALRSDFNTYARDTGERVSSLETQMRSLYGNGQAGRVTLLEGAVERLKQWRWYLIGAAAGGGGVISVIAWVVTEGSYVQHQVECEKCNEV